MTLPYSLDESDRRATLGLIVLQADETVDPDFRWLMPHGSVRLYPSRVHSPPEITMESLPTMQEALPAAIRLLPPAADIAVIGYACTSASAVLGEERVAEIVRTARPDVAVTNPLSALKAACRALGIRRLAVVSPYVPDVSQSLIDRLEAAGIAVPTIASFGQKEERIVARIAPASVHAAILETARRTPCDAIFASCTNLRAVEVVAEAERTLGMPVLSSNLVLAWHMLRLAGIEDRLGCGGALSEVATLAEAAVSP